MDGSWSGNSLTYYEHGTWPNDVLLGAIHAFAPWRSGIAHEDIIATGTPGGVGEAMEPKRYLTSGDVVEVSVTSVGSIRNRFAASEEAKLD